MQTLPFGHKFAYNAKNEKKLKPVWQTIKEARLQENLYEEIY
jgi:hypothetical protein